jgi:hypothetical protein
MFRLTTGVLIVASLLPLNVSQLVSPASGYLLLENWATGTPAAEVFGRVSGGAFDHRERVLVSRRRECLDV